MNYDYIAAVSYSPVEITNNKVPRIEIRVGHSEYMFKYLNQILCIAYGFKPINCSDMDDICNFVVEKLNTDNPTRLLITIVDNIHHRVYHNSPSADDLYYLGFTDFPYYEDISSNIPYT